MSLHRLRVLSHDLVQRVEGHVPDVVIAVDQEAAKNVNGKHAQARLDLDGHDREHALVQDRVARILGALGVGRHLREDVVHLVRGFGVARAKDAQHSQDLDLQEGIDDAVHVVLGGIAREHEVLQRRDQRRRVPPQLVDHAGLDDTHLAHELQRRQQHRMVARSEQRAHAVDVRVHELRALAQDADRAERGLLRNEGVGAHHELLNLG